ncbi:hypothetical protein BJV77DRAFT_966954 [Russula vinacea]|nr:hypothetical protein BJV77DRAFT_966954 [Russula vinacea]
MTAPPTSFQAYFEGLTQIVSGEVYRRGDDQFQEYTRIFINNESVLKTVNAVVLPLDTQDVSEVIIFCGKHGLSLSVTTCEYGTDGWAIDGDVVIDLSKIQDIDIEPPQRGGGYTSLSDTALSTNKGKARVGEPVLELSDRSVAKQFSSPLATYQPRGFAAARQPRHTQITPTSAPSLVLCPLFGNRLGDTRYDSRLVALAPLGLGCFCHFPHLTVWVGAELPDTALSRPDPFAYIDRAEPPMMGVSRSSMICCSDAALFAHPAFVPSHLTRPVPPHTHAYISFGAGAKQKDIDTFTAANTLKGGIVPYHIPFSAHPVGTSVMLLGGFGFLSRLHGLSIDNLVEAEAVLADGSVVIVNEKEHPDLWWGLRGAGPALCIVTRYKARAYPVPIVFAGNLIYATAPSLLRHFRDCVKGASRELYANVLLIAGPANEYSLVVIHMCYAGPKEQGVKYLQAFSSWDGGPCLLNEVQEKTFLNQMDSVTQLLRGKQWFIHSALISSLPDEVIYKTVIEFAESPVGCEYRAKSESHFSVRLFQLSGGAIVDYKGTCIPKAQREAAFTIAALHQWGMGDDDQRRLSSAENVRSSPPLWFLRITRSFPPPTKQWLREMIKSEACGGAFPSWCNAQFLGWHEIPTRVSASFDENSERLVALKKKYDPIGLFRGHILAIDEDVREMGPTSDR